MLLLARGFHFSGGLGPCRWKRKGNGKMEFGQMFVRGAIIALRSRKGRSRLDPGEPERSGAWHLQSAGGGRSFLESCDFE